MTSKGGGLLRSNLPLGDTILRGASYFVTGPAKAGPLFSRSLVSFPDCRDGLPTIWLGQVSHASSPLPSVQRFSYKLFPLSVCQQMMQEPGEGVFFFWTHFQLSLGTAMHMRKRSATPPCT